MTSLTDEELRLFLTEHAEWAVVGGAIVREWTFSGFVEAIAFVNRVAVMAEAAEHHPEIEVRFRRVRLSLVTHDAGGITAQDTAFARAVSTLG